MFSTESENDMVECPYNKHHRMLRKRLIPHLIKCRLSFPDAELCKCPFNASHLVPEPEFTHHVSSCPDKGLIHQYKYNPIPLKLDEEDRKHEEIECAENWDDTEVDDYDPKCYASSANVLRAHIGDLPSNRKEFRKAERKRLGDLDSSDDEDIKAFRERVYKDMDCKKEENDREEKWYEDHGSTSNAGINRRDSYTESLKEFSKAKDSRKRQSSEIDTNESIKTTRKEESSFDDNYYKNSDGTRSYLGSSRGVRRKYH